MSTQSIGQNEAPDIAPSRNWQKLTVESLPWLMLSMPYFLECEMFYFPSIDWPHHLWVLQSPYWGFLAACLLTAILFRKPARNGSRAFTLIDAVSGVALIAAVLLVQTRILGPSPQLILLGQSLCGAAAAWQYARWGQCLASVDIRHAASHICCSFILMGALKCALFTVPVVRPLIDMALVPIAMLGLRKCLALCAVSPSNETAVSNEVFRLRDVWLIPVAIVFLSGSIGVMYAARYNTFGSSGGLQILLGNILETLVVAIVFFWVCIRKRSLDVVGIVAVMTAVVATSCLMLTTLGGRAASCAFFLTSIDYELLNLFVWVLLTALSAKIPKNAGFIFAIGWMLRSAPALMGECVAKATNTELCPITCSVLMHIACAVLVAVIFGRNVSTANFFDHLSAEAPPDKTNLSQRCRELTDTYRLTAREAEVLELLAEGRTRPYIAESLGISENTVRVYTAKIYGKLGIHDRSSLFMLVYSSTDGNPAEHQAG